VHNGTVEFGTLQCSLILLVLLVVFISMQCILCTTFMHDGLHFVPHYFVFKTMGTMLAQTILTASSTDHQQWQSISNPAEKSESGSTQDDTMDDETTMTVPEEVVTGM